MKRFLCCLVVALAVGGWLPGVACVALQKEYKKVANKIHIH